MEMYLGPAGGAEGSPTFGSGPHAGDGFPIHSRDFGFTLFLKPYTLEQGPGDFSLRWRFWFGQCGVGFPSSKLLFMPSTDFLKRGSPTSDPGWISGATLGPLPAWSPRGSSSPQDCGNEKIPKHRGRKREISPFLIIAEPVRFSQEASVAQKKTKELEAVARQFIS
jgi:hypothetical protein